MSIQVIAWVFEQDIKPSTAKFVLVGLCNYIQPDATAWCAISTLSSITSQDIKTVRRGLRMLEELGHIHNTGKKAGFTAQIPLYKVRLPDAVLFKLSKGTNLGRKGYQSSRERLPKTVGKDSPNGYPIHNDPLVNPLLTSGEKQQTANIEQIADHIAKLKGACRK